MEERGEKKKTCTHDILIHVPVVAADAKKEKMITCHIS